ncbi:lactate utilization protein C [Mesobacillus subterraneus]|uniref:LutC/YkgG family protein n=1 Tax=Mesobacillus subterraneus TaxID=285983 RepID=UPI001CFDC764|nr:lactate utilization protein C [Mesobacillus subterraneus]WLR54528.1 lactate utilization protein C [Mesobacillus subterraneus]
MSIQNREAFLDKLASRLGRERRTAGVERPQWSVTPQDEVFHGMSQDELVDVLEKHCKVIHTTFKRTDRDGLTKVLNETLEDYEGKLIITSKDPRYQEYGVTEFFEEQKEQLDVHVWDSAQGKKNQQIAERADVGIVFSDITLAESGTVTSFNTKDNGRSISLLPRTFIAIIPKSTLVPRMTQAARHIHQAQANGEDVPSYVSFITGPSNSADIEMNLIVGVHGPVKATYIVVD